MANRTVLVTLQGNVAGYMASMRAASAATAQFAGTAAKSTTSAVKPMKSLGQEARMLPMGLSATTTALGAVAVAAVASGKAAVDWETAWTGVTKTVDGSPEQMAALEAELRGLAKTLPATHEEIAGVAEAAGQLGIERENVAGFTKTMIDLGETTNLQAGEAATALARFMNIMGTSQSEVGRLGSSVVELGNNFATTEAEIVEMATRIASAGRQIGLTEGDVFGLATALSSVGIEAEAGGTAISRVMIDMAKSVDTGNEKLATFAAVAGMTSDQFVAAFRDDAGAALTAFIEGLGGIQASGESVQPVLEALGLTDVRVGNAMRSAASASDLFTDALRTGNAAYEENVALTDEASKRYETMASRLDVAKNKAKDASITIGGPLAESFVAVVEPLADLVDWLDRFNQQLPEAKVGSESFKFDIFKGAIPQFIELIGFVRELDIAQGDVTLSAAEMGERFNQAGEDMRFANRAALDSAGGMDSAARAAGNASGEVDALGQSAEDAAAELEGMADAIRGLGGTTLDLRDAQRQAQQAIDDARKSVKENGATLDINTQKGRNNAAALDELAASFKEQAAATLLQTGSQKRANAVIEDGREAFIRAADAMNIGAGKAEKLANRLGLVPRDVETTVTQPGMDSAMSKASTYAEQIRGLDRTVRTTIQQHFVVTGERVAGVTGSGGRTLKDGGWASAPRLAPGGWVAGTGTGMSDSVPAWLSRGEFVVNSAAAATNAALLEAINSGKRAAVAGDTIIVNTTTEAVVRDIAAHQSLAALRRRVAG